MWRYGFEIEIVGKDNFEVFDILRGKLPDYKWNFRDKAGWNIGTDQTVDTEIRSPILTDTTPIFPVLKALKEGGCHVNRRCGFHVHVSHEDGRSLDSLKLQERYLVITKRHIAFRHRRQYCQVQPNTTGFGLTDARYMAVRQVSDNHVEFRMFNGTLNCHGVKNYLMLVSKILL